MKKPKLLLITNTANDSVEDATFLAPALGQWFHVTITNPSEAISLLAVYDVCLLRNAWPSRLMKEALKILALAIQREGIPSYNPVGDNNFVEDKTYLVDLMREGFPVIPTILDKTAVSALGCQARYLIKPLDGCSSDGVRVLDRVELETTNIRGHVLQPYVEFTHEVSFFFIDDVFIYAMRTKAERWDLELWMPEADQIAWAHKFVAWNSLPYGIQRIDAIVTPDGRLLLMEIEDIAPFLSLHLLPPDLYQVVTSQLAESLLCVVLKKS